MGPHSIIVLLKWNPLLSTIVSKLRLACYLRTDIDVHLWCGIATFIQATYLKVQMPKSKLPGWWIGNLFIPVCLFFFFTSTHPSSLKLGWGRFPNPLKILTPWATWSKWRLWSQSLHTLYEVACFDTNPEMYGAIQVTQITGLTGLVLSDGEPYVQSLLILVQDSWEQLGKHIEHERMPCPLHYSEKAWEINCIELELRNRSVELTDHLVVDIEVDERCNR